MQNYGRAVLRDVHGGQTGLEGTGTHTQMLQAGFSHICSPAVGPRLSIAQLFQLKNVNSRERDTSVRESTAQQPHSSTGRSFAWHWRRLDAGGMDLEESIQPFPGQTTGMFSATPSALSPVRVTQPGRYQSPCDKPCPQPGLSHFPSCPSPATIPSPSIAQGARCYNRNCKKPHGNCLSQPTPNFAGHTA